MNGIQQLGTGEDTPGLARQGSQQFELRRRQFFLPEVLAEDLGNIRRDISLTRGNRADRGDQLFVAPAGQTNQENEVAVVRVLRPDVAVSDQEVDQHQRHVELEVLAGGEEKVVTLTKLKSMQGKPLADPVLKAAGINGKVTKPSGDDPALTVDYTGGTDAIKEVEILDAAGNSVSNGRFSTGFGGTQSVSYQLSKPLDDTMTMKMHLIVGQKTVKVPFELKDVKLP